MKTLSIKVKGSMGNPNVGYIKPLLIQEPNGWAIGNHETVPKNAEVWVISSYTDQVDNKYREGEIFQVSIEELSEDRKGDCEFRIEEGGRFSSPEAELGLHTVLSFRGMIDPNRTFQTTTLIKPTRYSFFIGNDLEKGKVLFGPLEVVNAVFDPLSASWDCTYQAMSEVIASKFDLTGNEIYYVDFDLVPNDALFKSEEFSNAEHEFFLSLDLPNLFRSVGATKKQFADDKTLLKLLDDLQDNAKLGRSGQRALLKAMTASRVLSEVDSDRISEMISTHLDRLDNLFPLTNGNSQPAADNVSDPQREKQHEGLITELRRQFDDEKRRSAQLEVDLENARALLSDAPTNQITRLEVEVAEYKRKEEYVHTIQSMEATSEKLENQIIQKQEKRDLLVESVDEIEAQLKMSMRNFRTKAMEVLPLFGVLSSNSSDGEQQVSIKNLNDDECFDPDDEDFVTEIVNRVREQGYIASDEFLYSSAALFLSSKFIGLYGTPGTGKTTLAKLLAHSVAGSSSEVETCRVSVGKGWSSHSDFFGYLNPFSDQFSYKNPFFSQFEDSSQHLQPLKTIIFDEASLSNPDIYLSDFFNEPEFDFSSSFEKLILSGRPFYFPSSLRSIMTFNFDESTERLSRKFVDRVPILHCEYQRESENAQITSKQFDPFHSGSLSGMLGERAQQAKAHLTVYSDTIFNEVDRWRETLPFFTVSGRKLKHISFFLALFNDEMDISSEFIRDFVALSFLVPQISGQGDAFASALDELQKGSPENTRGKLAEIITAGSKYNQFTYL